MSFEEFRSNPDHFRIAFYDLHRSLEAVLDIGSHILSRIPGSRPSSYKDIPRFLGKNKVIPREFADSQLTRMAGYRSRMVHFYGEITEKEIYNIIQQELSDFESFIRFVERLLKNSEKLNLRVE